jgi:deoxyribodipyrimidine photolyase
MRVAFWFRRDRRVSDNIALTQAATGNPKTLRRDEKEVEQWEGSAVETATFQPIERNLDEATQLLQLSRLEGRDPLQDALMGRLAGDRLESDSDNPSIDATIRNYARDLRRELAERFNEIAPTKMSATVPQM